MSVCQSVRQSACLSLLRGSTRLRCAKTTKQIKILFGVNTIGGHKKHIVLDGGPDTPPSEGERFDAAFAKLLWPLVILLSEQDIRWLVVV